MGTAAGQLVILSDAAMCDIATLSGAGVVPDRPTAARPWSGQARCGVTGCGLVFRLWRTKSNLVCCGVAWLVLVCTSLIWFQWRTQDFLKERARAEIFL